MPIRNWLGGLLIIIVIVLIVVTSWSIAATESKSVTPGSADDPIITKSYVDEQVAKLVATELSKMKQSFEQQMTEQVKEAKETAQATFVEELKKMKQVAEMESANVKLVTIKPGYWLQLQLGAEVILRKGKAISANPERSGISNVTTGKSVGHRELIPADHLLMFSKDSRGIQHSSFSKVNLVVLVKGNHAIKKIGK
jgi:hypothetical protein